VGYHTKSWENRPGMPPNGAKKCFVFSVSSYPVRISAIFDTTDVNRCACACNHKNIQISAQMFFRPPKIRNFGPGTCTELATQNARFWAIGITFGASRYPKGVFFIREFYRRTYGWGAMTDRKELNFDVQNVCRSHDRT